jgi:hypothetical protein
MKKKNQKVVNFYHYTMQLIFIEIHWEISKGLLEWSKIYFRPFLNKVRREIVNCKLKHSEELGNESASWSSELSQVSSRQEKLLGDVFQLSVYICVFPPFGPKSRYSIVCLDPTLFFDEDFLIKKKRFMVIIYQFTQVSLSDENEFN